MLILPGKVLLGHSFARAKVTNRNSCKCIKNQYDFVETMNRNAKRKKSESSGYKDVIVEPLSIIFLSTTSSSTIFGHLDENTAFWFNRIGQTSERFTPLISSIMFGHVMVHGNESNEYARFRTSTLDFLAKRLFRRQVNNGETAMSIRMMVNEKKMLCWVFFWAVLRNTRGHSTCCIVTEVPKAIIIIKIMNNDTWSFQEKLLLMAVC